MDLVTLAEEILNGRLHFLCSDGIYYPVQFPYSSHTVCPVQNFHLSYDCYVLCFFLLHLYLLPTLALALALAIFSSISSLFVSYSIFDFCLAKFDSTMNSATLIFSSIALSLMLDL